MTPKNNHGFWKQDKLAFWVLSILTLILYTAKLSITTVGGSFGEESATGLKGIIEFLAPYRFLLGVGAISVLLPSPMTTKRYIFWLLSAALFAATALKVDEIYIWEDSTISNVQAYLTVLTGLFAVLSLPKLDLWKKVIVGLVIGVILGFDIARFDTVSFLAEYVKLFGTIFINMIMMIVTPLIFFSLVSGINTISDTNALSRVGTKALFTYLFTSMFAVAIGIAIGHWFEPGVGLDLSGLHSSSSSEFELPILFKTILAIIPDNGLGAMAGTTMVKFGVVPNASSDANALKHILEQITVSLKPDTLKTVFFAIFVGVTLVVMGDKGKNVSHFCHDAAQLMFKMIGFIINLAPLAVFGLMAWVTATLGIDALLQLGKLVVATITGMGIQYIFLILCFVFILRLNPLPFMKKSLEYQMIAFSTSSSKATLATSMDVAERKLGISKPINSFILPLGAAVNMDGTAIYLGITALFFAQAYGVDLEFYQYCLIVFTSTIAAVGAAGYPGGSLIVMTLVLTSIGVPTEGIALLVGVDRILDMFRTTINITSDVAITAFIDRTEGTFDEKIYYTPNEEIHDEEIHGVTKVSKKVAAVKELMPQEETRATSTKLPAKKKKEMEAPVKLAAKPTAKKAKKKPAKKK